MHRFDNRPVEVGGRLHWDVLSLYAGVLDGLRAAGRTGPLDGVGIDTWAVDVGCWTPTAPSWATRCTTATPATQPASRRCTRSPTRPSCTG